jgi:hypothetical protein
VEGRKEFIACLHTTTLHFDHMMAVR